MSNDASAERQFASALSPRLYLQEQRRVTLCAMRSMYTFGQAGTTISDLFSLCHYCLRHYVRKAVEMIVHTFVMLPLFGIHYAAVCTW